MQPFQEAEFEQDQNKLQEFRNLAGKSEFGNLTEEQIEDIIKQELSKRVYINDIYQVAVKEVSHEGWPEAYWLSIRRRDREVIRDWREFQKIKNLIVGEENEGFEIFPAESRLVDTSNQYHMFVFKDPDIRIPFGFAERSVSEGSIGGSKQRPLDKIG